MSSLYGIALFACLLLIALLAASEAALAATNRVRLRHLLQVGESSGDSAQALTSDLSGDARRFLATVTIAANVPILLASVLATRLALARWEMPIAIVVLSLGAFITVAWLQITPRLLVSRRGALDRLGWVRPARALVAFFNPFVGVLLWLGDCLLRPFGLESSAKTETFAEEIRDLVESAQTSGGSDDDRELIESIFTFGDTRVHEVMIPRPDILALAVDAPADAVLDALENSGFSRLPLHEGGIDRIAGVLHAKDALGALGKDEPFEPRALMRPALFLPESQKIDDAFAAMRLARTHLAIVIDEYGGTAGLLTVEDILEELVGEIADEHDRPGEEPLQTFDENTALADAGLHADDLEELWDVVLPTGEFDSVGGFMMEQLGRALVVGDRVEVPGAVLTVHSVRARRPRKIFIRKTPVATENHSE
ncbi:MAG TPA: hemolysin family protein [Abditibacteriaceae bacterium]|jgi:CBS domain containing-hemolysin-like protein